MRVVVQKVTRATVTVGEEQVGAIGVGYVLLVGVARGDGEREVEWLTEKIARLRLFPGDDGKINDRTVGEVGGGVLVVPQFTLLGSLQGGHRPDYSGSADKEMAAALMAQFVAALKRQGIAPVEEGRFGAYMAVSLVNDGPVTLWLERVPERMMSRPGAH